jgi:hypothetical protein
MFYLNVELFALSFMSVSYCINFIFDKSENAFNFSLLVFMLLVIIPLVTKIWITGSGYAKFCEYVFPPSTFQTNMFEILAQTDNLYSNEVYFRFLVYILQCFAFISITMSIDYHMNNKFRGKDLKTQTIERA